MHSDGEQPERLAPVTPLFGERRAGAGPDAPARLRPQEREGQSGRHHGDPEKHESHPDKVVPRRTGDAGLWRSTWDDDDEHSVERADGALHPALGGHRREAEREKPRLRALRPHDDGPSDDFGDPAQPERAIDAAREVLVRKLRSKALSVSEARLVLRGQELDGAHADAIIDEFCERGYLDDATLAWHLVTSGVERKGQGRVALMRALTQRGIPGEVIDDALRELPDDDAERALEFARSKARSFSGVDHDTALRRLVGQLSRRGYGGSVAMTAARTALGEINPSPPRSGVRFVDSE